MVTRSRDRSLQTTQFLISRHPIAFTISLDIKKPKSFIIAQKDSQWVALRTVDSQALLNSRTWDMVPPTAQYSVIHCQWCIKWSRSLREEFQFKHERILDCSYDCDRLGHTSYGCTFQTSRASASMKHPTFGPTMPTTRSSMKSPCKTKTSTKEAHPKIDAHGSRLSAQCKNQETYSVPSS